MWSPRHKAHHVFDYGLPYDTLVGDVDLLKRRLVPTQVRKSCSRRGAASGRGLNRLIVGADLVGFVEIGRGSARPAGCRSAAVHERSRKFVRPSAGDRDRATAFCVFVRVSNSDLRAPTTNRGMAKAVLNDVLLREAASSMMASCSGGNFRVSFNRSCPCHLCSRV